MWPESNVANILFWPRKNILWWSQAVQVRCSSQLIGVLIYSLCLAQQTKCVLLRATSEQSATCASAKAASRWNVSPRRRRRLLWDDTHCIDTHCITQSALHLCLLLHCSVTTLQELYSAPESVAESSTVHIASLWGHFCCGTWSFVYWQHTFCFCKKGLWGSPRDLLWALPGIVVVKATQRLVTTVTSRTGNTGGSLL